MRPWLVFFTCCLHLFTQKRTYPVESSVSPLQLLTLDSRCCIPLHNCLYLKLLTLDSSLELIWAAQQHFVCFQQVLAWTHFPSKYVFFAFAFAFILFFQHAHAYPVQSHTVINVQPQCQWHIPPATMMMMVVMTDHHYMPATMNSMAMTPTLCQWWAQY